MLFKVSRLLRDDLKIQSNYTMHYSLTTKLQKYALFFAHSSSNLCWSSFPSLLVFPNQYWSKTITSPSRVKMFIPSDIGTTPMAVNMVGVFRVESYWASATIQRIHRMEDLMPKTSGELRNNSPTYFRLLMRSWESRSIHIFYSLL